MVLAALLVGTAEGASAEPLATTSARKAKATKKGTPVVTVDVPALTEKLKSSDPAEVGAALAEAKAASKGARPVAPAVEELLRRGTDAELTALALQTLGEVGNETSAAAILPYRRHRNPDTRKKALLALSRTGGTGAVAALREALSDPDAGVRGVAASGLGALGAHEAVSDLFAALDHDIAEAAASIGQICTPVECEKLAAKLSTFGLDVMTSAFDSILFRRAAEVPDDAKVRLIARVRDLHTEEATKYLRDVASRWPGAESTRVRQALEQAIQAGGGKS